MSAILFICVFTFKPLADTLADKKPQMLAFQKDLEGSVKSFFSVGIDLQDGTVSNHYPSYSEKTDDDGRSKGRSAFIIFT